MRLAALTTLQKVMARMFQGTLRGYTSVWRSHVRAEEEARWRSDRLGSVKAKIQLERRLASIEIEAERASLLQHRMSEAANESVRRGNINRRLKRVLSLRYRSGIGERVGAWRERTKAALKRDQLSRLSLWMEEVQRVQNKTIDLTNLESAANEKKKGAAIRILRQQFMYLSGGVGLAVEVWRMEAKMDLHATAREAALQALLQDEAADLSKGKGLRQLRRSLAEFAKGELGLRIELWRIGLRVAQAGKHDAVRGELQGMMHAGKETALRLVKDVFRRAVSMSLTRTVQRWRGKVTADANLGLLTSFKKARAKATEATVMSRLGGLLLSSCILNSWQQWRMSWVIRGWLSNRLHHQEAQLQAYRERNATEQHGKLLRSHDGARLSGVRLMWRFTGLSRDRQVSRLLRGWQSAAIHGFYKGHFERVEIGHLQDLIWVGSANGEVRLCEEILKKCHKLQNENEDLWLELKAAYTTHGEAKRELDRLDEALNAAHAQLLDSAVKLDKLEAIEDDRSPGWEAQQRERDGAYRYPISGKAAFNAGLLAPPPQRDQNQDLNLDDLAPSPGARLGWSSRGDRGGQRLSKPLAGRTLLDHLEAGEHEDEDDEMVEMMEIPGVGIFEVSLRPPPNLTPVR